MSDVVKESRHARRRRKEGGFGDGGALGMAGGVAGMSDGAAPKPKVPADATTWQKAVVANAQYTKDEFPELHDVIYWMRSALGLVIGIVWGLVPLTNAPGIVSFGAVNAVVVWLYYARFLNVDVESYGAFDLLSEGFMPAFGCFLLTWIMTYSSLHAGV